MAAILPKKKRISKKTRAAWRKTDVQDVEQFLEEQRQEERIGTFTHQKDEELFVLDTQAADKSKDLVVSRKQRRKLNAQKPFKSHEALINRSKVQDPIVKRNHVNCKKNGRLLEEEVANPTKARHFQANADRQRYYEQLDKKLSSQKQLDTAKDIWAEQDFRDKIPGLKDEKGWISRDLSLYVSKNVGKPVVKVHDSIRHRTTKAKNFELPHAGTSYNPSLKDHQQLLAAVVEKEQKIIKQEKHLKRVTTRMFSKVTPEQRDERKLQEMQAGLDDDDGEEAKDNSNIIKQEALDDADVENKDADLPYNSINPAVENKKKSRQARNRELKQKALQKRQLEKKALKKQVADLNRIKSIKAEVLAEAVELNALKKHRKKVEFKKKFETKRLGRLKFVEPDVDINMMEDIAGNLRNLKPESSLLVDRFKNFQKRNILPTSVHTGKQKPVKIKRFTRNTHKDPGVSFDMLRQQRRSAQKQQAPEA